MVIEEQVTTKYMADSIDGGGEEVFEFNNGEGSQFDCQLPLRFRLPCKHWLYKEYVLRSLCQLGFFNLVGSLTASSYYKSESLEDNSISQSS
jgi:hypothetical protein